MPVVRSLYCSHKASGPEIYDALARVTAPLADSWKTLEGAGRILIKANAAGSPKRKGKFAGMYRELVDPAVFEGVLRLLRKRTGAELIVADTPLSGTGSDIYFKPLLEKAGAEFVNSDRGPLEWHDVPGGGGMFKRYLLTPEIARADAVVSLAKMKSHKSTGITLCVKNLFGLSPASAGGRPRHYIHHLVRLPFCMVDLAAIAAPCLNIIDGLVGQTRMEWGGEGVAPGLLIAGDDPFATDMCGARMMGHDPALDWPSPPYRRERSYIRLAVERGLCPPDMSGIDFKSDSEPAEGMFMPDKVESLRAVVEARKEACKMALLYRERVREFVDKYEHRYIVLQKGAVAWSGDNPEEEFLRKAVIAGDAFWAKYVDPRETEDENFGVYERELENIKRVERDILKNGAG